MIPYNDIISTRKQKLNTNNKFFFLWLSDYLASLWLFITMWSKDTLTLPRQVLTDGRKVTSSTIRDAASEVSLGLYKSQSQAERSLTCSEPSYMLNSCYLQCKTARPLPDYQSILTDNAMGYLLRRTRFRKSKKLYF